MRTSSFARLLRLSALGATVCLVSTACSKSDDAGAAPEAPRNENVNLPPVPELPLLDIPRVYPDKTLSVMGLLIDRDANMLKTLTVSGMVVDVYECENADAPSKPGNARTKGADTDDAPQAGCLYPHFYLADMPDSPKRVLVTGYDAAHYEPQLQEMTRYRVTGHYSVQARGFSSSETGLIVADRIEGSGIVAPGAELEE